VLERDARLLITRIVTGALFGVAVTASVLFLPTPAFAAVFGALWLAGAWEWAGFARLDGGARIAYGASFALAMLGAWLDGDDRLAVILLVAALAWWLVALGAVLTFPRRFGRKWVAVLGFVVLLPSWLLLTRVHAVPMHGAGLVMTLAPMVSPGKTWEGMAGGVSLAALAAGTAAWLLGYAIASFVVLGVATALISVLGDLTQSMFKRNVGLKDSGKLLPGHGGVLDRIDSLTAAAPLFAGGLFLLGIVG
jgi:phosphatidate cytidylyltransferase